MIQSRADLSEVDEQACLQSPTLTNLYGEKPRVSKQQAKLVVKRSSEAALLRMPALNHLRYFVRQKVHLVLILFLA